MYYSDWPVWHQIELGYKSRMSKSLLTIGKQLSQHAAVDFLPSSFRDLSAIAQALAPLLENQKAQF